MMKIPIPGSRTRQPRGFIQEAITKPAIVDNAAKEDRAKENRAKEDRVKEDRVKEDRANSRVEVAIKISQTPTFGVINTVRINAS